MLKSANSYRTQGLRGALLVSILIIAAVLTILNKTTIIRKIMLVDGGSVKWNGINVQLAKDNFFIDNKKNSQLVIGTFFESNSDIAVPLDARLTVVKGVTLKGYLQFLQAECNIVDGCRWTNECLETVPDGVKCLTVEGKLPREIKGTYHVFYGIVGSDISIMYDGDKRKSKYFSHEISSILGQIRQPAPFDATNGIK